MSVVNPFTGRHVKIGGATHIKLLKLLDQVETASHNQKGGGNGESAETADFYKQLLTKAKNVKFKPKKGAVDTAAPANIPSSKYNLISSNLPPNPEGHSWYHHHAPFSQSFGDYVCLKKSVLHELGVFLKDSLLSNVSN